MLAIGRVAFVDQRSKSSRLGECEPLKGFNFLIRHFKNLLVSPF